MLRNQLVRVFSAVRPQACVLSSREEEKWSGVFLRFASSKLAVRPSLSACAPNFQAFGRFDQRRSFCSEEDRPVSSLNIQDADDFETQVLGSRVPVVVEFHADWCGPCKMLGPRLEAIVDEKGGRVMLAKINIDHLAELAMDYEVNSVPTVMAFKDGALTGDSFIGMVEDERIHAFVDNLLDE